MTRRLNKLSAQKVEALLRRRPPGRHSDGGSLYLSISPNGGARWVFLSRWNGRPREVGLGSAQTVSLKTAREIAGELREKAASGVRPVSPRRAAGGATFADVADRLLEAKRPEWRSAKHAEDWQRHLTVLAKPLRSLPVASIATENILATIRPLWGEHRVTAQRLRNRVEQVLDAASAEGLRTGANPARWRGHLDSLLPKAQRIEQAHHAAMPYGQVPAFMQRLRAREGVGARMLEFAILCASRTAEIRLMTWDEVDVDGALWEIPAGRTKAGRAHTVPLSSRALDILRSLARTSRYVFPGRDRGKPRGAAYLQEILRTLDAGEATPHGFRSSFRDWAGDATNFAREVAEAALGHAVGDRTEAAYRRSTALGKRAKLMQAWSDYCSRPASGHVVPLKRPA